MDNVVRIDKQERQNRVRYRVFTKADVHIGDIECKEDGIWDFWPLTPRAGYWPDYLLKTIYDKLRELNEPFEKELEEYHKGQESDHK